MGNEVVAATVLAAICAIPAALVSVRIVMPSLQHGQYLPSMQHATSIPSAGRSESSVGRNTSQWCWKANDLCESMRDYVRLNGLTHIFVGASAKVAGTSVKAFFYPLDELLEGVDADAFFTKMMKHRCRWAISGSHLHGGLGPMLEQPCAPKTLFLLPVREEMSWMRSALGQVCWALGQKEGGQTCSGEACPETCGNPQWLNENLRSKPMELQMGPHNWIEEWMVRSPDFHTFMFDYSATAEVLACLPKEGLKVEDQESPELASHVYKRDGLMKPWNSGAKRPSVDLSDDDILAGYQAENYMAYWVQPYVKAIKESGCEVASALGLQVVEHRTGEHR